MSVWQQFNAVPSWIELLMMAVAAWRVAVFLVREAGPFDIMIKIRGWLGIDHDVEGRPLPYIGGMPASLFSCVWCMSFWTAIMVYVVGVYADVVVAVLAVWGLVAVIESGIESVTMFIECRSFHHEASLSSDGDMNNGTG